MAHTKLEPGTYTFAELFTSKTASSKYTAETLRAEVGMVAHKVTEIGHRYVPTQYVRDVARLLRITPEEVAGVKDVEIAVSYMWSPDTGAALRNVRGSRKKVVFGQLLGVNSATINRWEQSTAKPKVTNVLKFQTILGLDLYKVLEAGIWPPDPIAGATGLGRALSATRHQMGLSTRKMALKLRVPEPTYRGWESGRAQPKKPEDREKLARALGVDVSLIEGTLLAERRTDTYGIPEWSKRLVKIREDRNISIEDLARSTGVPLALLRSLEKGIKPSKWNFFRVSAAARAYCVDTMWLLVESSGHTPETFQDKMRYWRVATGMTIKAVSTHVGYHRNTVVHWETGVLRPPVAAASLIAEAYGLDEGMVVAEIKKAGPVLVAPFAKALLEARGVSGDNMLVVAKRLGVLPQSIKQVEASQWLPSEGRLQQYATAYGASLEALQAAWAACVTPSGIALAKRHEK